MEAVAVGTLKDQGFFERAHGDEGVDAVMLGGLEPGVGVAGGKKMAMGVDYAAANLGARHGLSEVEADAVIVRRLWSGGWRLDIGGGHEILKQLRPLSNEASVSG